MKPKTVAELRKCVGFTVEIQFKDGSLEHGILGYTEEFSAKYGFRKPHYFTINNIDFKLSHVDYVVVTGIGERLDI